MSSAVYVVYYLYPSMMIHLLRLFHCTPPIHGAGYDGNTYLYANLEVECGSAKHTGARGIAVIFLCLYIVAIPALILWVTVKNKHRLREKAFCTMYGFIFIGYEKDSAWWEIIVLARKLALVAILVFFSKDQFLQSFFGLFVLLVATAAQQYRRPFEKAMLDRMELFGLYALVLTQLLSIFYFWVDEQGHMGEEEKGRTTLWTTVLLLAIHIDAVIVFAREILLASLKILERWRAYAAYKLCGGPVPIANDDDADGEGEEDEDDAGRPPIPGLETLCLLIWGACGSRSGRRVGRDEALARFRKAGRAVIAMQRGVAAFRGGDARSRRKQSVEQLRRSLHRAPTPAAGPASRIPTRKSVRRLKYQKQHTRRRALADEQALHAMAMREALAAMRAEHDGKTHKKHNKKKGNKHKKKKKKGKNKGHHRGTVVRPMQRRAYLPISMSYHRLQSMRGLRASFHHVGEDNRFAWVDHNQDGVVNALDEVREEQGVDLSGGYEEL